MVGAFSFLLFTTFSEKKKKKIREESLQHPQLKSPVSPTFGKMFRRHLTAVPVHV